MTLGTGSRGAAARAIVEDPASVLPGGAGLPVRDASRDRCSLLERLRRRRSTAYQARFPDAAGPRRRVHRRHRHLRARLDAGVLGHGQALRRVHPRLEQPVAVPRVDATRPRSTRSATPTCRGPSSVFVATGPKVYNEVFMWGPHDVRREGPRPLRNVVPQNKKVPLTDDRAGARRWRPGPSTGPDAVENLRPYRVPGTRARIGFATSLPAFIYGDPPAGVDPCSDTSKYYMRCLDKLGTNLVMQDEANPGPWVTRARRSGSRSTGCAPPGARSSDPTVDFDYNVTPHLVGQLGDLVFDGQTAITQRGLRGPRALHLRRQLALPCRTRRRATPPRSSPTPGRKREFLALAPVGGAGRAARRAAGGAGQARARLGRPARERLPRDGDRGRPAVPARLAGGATASRRPTAARPPLVTGRRQTVASAHGVVAPALPVTA